MAQLEGPDVVVYVPSLDAGQFFGPEDKLKTLRKDSGLRPIAWCNPGLVGRVAPM